MRLWRPWEVSGGRRESPRDLARPRRGGPCQWLLAKESPRLNAHAGQNGRKTSSPSEREERLISAQSIHRIGLPFRPSSRVGHGRPCREEYSPGLESSGPQSLEAPSLRFQKIRASSVWRRARPFQSSSTRVRPTQRRVTPAVRG